MKRGGKLQLDKTVQQPKVKKFIDSFDRKGTREIFAVGLGYFQTFLNQNPDYKDYTLDTVIEPLTSGNMDVYVLLRDFIQYLKTVTAQFGQNTLSQNSIKSYLTGVRNYLQYYDITIDSYKFKKRVRPVKVAEEEGGEEPITVSDFRKILKACNNRRLKAYLLVLASSGLRAKEAVVLRMRDVDFSVNPTKVHVRKEYSKTRKGRDRYISDEASEALTQWIDFKNKSQPDDIIFQSRETRSNDFDNIYFKLGFEFNKILDAINMNERREGMLRRKITFHGLRGMVYTIIDTQAGKNYAEWYLGHGGNNPYYKKPPAEKMKIYIEKCMPELTFLDFTAVEARGKAIESKLDVKDQQITQQNEEISTLKQQLEAMKIDVGTMIEDRLKTMFGDVVPEEIGLSKKFLSKEKKILKGLNKSKLVGEEQLYFPETIDKK